MKKVYDLYYDFLAQNVIVPFYEKRFEKLNQLKLDRVLKKKNPYLFKAKNIETAGDFVKSILDAHLSSQEETMFGDLLEGFAIYVSAKLYGGFKSAFPSIDLEFKRGDTYNIVSIKSGTAWGNRDQVDRMKDNFKAARQALRKRPEIPRQIIAVNGCMYGRDKNPLKAHSDRNKIYYKYAGQDFWEFISEDEGLYQEIIKPIDKEAKRKDERFRDAYNAKVNEMTKDFIDRFITDNQIDWIGLVDYVSKSSQEKIASSSPPSPAVRPRKRAATD
jgi:hypothetical protein